jgi:hypothetical protein
VIDYETPRFTAAFLPFVTTARSRNFRLGCGLDQYVLFAAKETLIAHVSTSDFGVVPYSYTKDRHPRCSAMITKPRWLPTGQN